MQSLFPQRRKEFNCPILHYSYEKSRPSRHYSYEKS